ncbi:MAG TPA: kelch repeat-containing protein, partial [Blastocatellia bacterium]|nr:kelch repeat-containing protein [Blastocatellia bacterium]
MSLRRFSSSRSFLTFSLVFTFLLAGGLFLARRNSAQAIQPQTQHLASGILAAAKPLPATLVLHTATLLNNGRVLVVGGTTDGTDAGATNQTYLYDPRTGEWTETGVMRIARKGHFAVLLQNGRVLVGGGKNGGGFLNSAEIYDPDKQTWAPTGNLTQPRHRASATLLANATNASTARNGFVLAVGGESSSPAVLDTAEFFNPATGQWKATATKLRRARVNHTATLLTGGDVMIAGGYATPSQPIADVEVYDPLADRWKTTNSMKTARFGHSATMLTTSKVLVAGGIGPTGGAMTSVEIFDAPSHTWTTESAVLPQARAFHSSSLLPNGSVFVVGGFASINGAANNQGIVYSPDTRQWTSAGNFGEARGAHTATILANARVLIVGGAASGDLKSALSSVEFHDPAVGKWLVQGGAMNQPRYAHTATLLATGKVLIVGGRDANGSMKSAELYDPATDTWTRTADMSVARADHTATLLRNGKVLVAGGNSNGTILDTAEVYDPVTASWSPTANLKPNRSANHTATLLADGRVMTTGGWNTLTGVNILRGCDLYNPATNQWTTTGTLTSQRRYHTTTLLYDGRVLAAGGEPTTSLKTSELYNPSTGQWTAVASQMHVGHLRHTASLLPNGKVLVVSGLQGTNTPTNYSGSANLFDPNPSNPTWASVTSPAGRDGHTATMLPNGKVIIAGGYVVQNSGGTGAFVNNVDAVELYDPSKGAGAPFNETTKITFPRDAHTATLLPNGRVLFVGGRAQVTTASGNAVDVLVDKVELFDVGLDAAPSVIPGLTQATWNGGGAPVCTTGVKFQGGGEAAGGNVANSSTNYPVVQLMRLDNEQIYFLSPDATATACGFAGWTNNRYASLSVPTITALGTNNSLHPGIALMTVFVNGIPNGRATILAPEAPADANESRINLTGRIFTVADTGLQVNIELRSSTGEVRNLLSGPNGEYIFEDVPTRTPSTSAATVAPSQIVEDSSSTPITVTGSGFTAASQIFFNGVGLTTTFVSSTQLSATIPATLLQNDGFASVVVRTPSGNTPLTTPPLTVRITPPNANTRPIISSLSPASTVVNVNPGSIAVIGTNLLNGTTQVLWNGQSRTVQTGQSTATRLIFTPLASDFAQAGTATVQVQNAGGTSNSFPFTVMAQAPPVINSLSPSSALVGAGPSEILIVGTNLVNTSTAGTATTQVLWNGQSRTITRSSATQIAFQPLRTDFLQAGSATIRVFHRTVTINGETQVLSNIATFTINQQPQPTISSISPATFALPAASTPITDQTLTVNGTNFVSNSVVRAGGRSLTTTFVSSTRLTATLPGALLATVSTAAGTTQSGLAITVLNPSTNLISNSSLLAVTQTAAATLGSVLAFPYYTSLATNPTGQNTTFSITNTNTQLSTTVNLLFIDGATGYGSYYFRNIGANQTLTFKASDFDRGTTGYLLAVATTANGNAQCPVPFNFLRGTAAITTTSGFAGTVSAIPLRSFAAPSCSSRSFTAQLDFNGTQYDRVPGQITADSIYSASSSASTLLVTSAFGGTLYGESRAGSLGSLFGTVVESSLATYSFFDSRSASQIATQLDAKFPVTNPRLDQILSPGEAGKLTEYAGPALIGMTLTKTPSFSFATLMRAVTLKSATLTIPVYNQPILLLTGRTRNENAPSTLQPADAATWERTQPRVPDSEQEAISGNREPSPQTQQAGSSALPTELQQQQQPGQTITYTITPSGNLPTGEPIEFFPASRTFPSGSGTISFAVASDVQAEGDNDFCGRTSSLLKLGGVITLPGGFTNESVAVNLKLTDAKAPNCNLPTDIPVSSSTVTGKYVGENAGGKMVLGLQGSYLITPADPRFEFRFQPLNEAEQNVGTFLHPPLSTQSLGNNFNAYVINTCPASITATANTDAAAQVCQGQPINLETPVVPNATSYTWTLPDNSKLNGR